MPVPHHLANLAGNPSGAMISASGRGLQPPPEALRALWEEIHPNPRLKGDFFAVCQQITWIWNSSEMLDEKNILPHVALTFEVADLFFKDITAPPGNGVLLCFLL